MTSIRTATVDDILAIQQANLVCLPENYHMKYYYYHVLSWPELIFVAEDADGKIVGYVLSKMEDEEPGSSGRPHGHVTSLAVLRSHRKLGLATKLMRASQRAMSEVYNSEFCSLHVRASNYAAFHLYRDTLGFEVSDVEKGYYADGEDAYGMRKRLRRKDFKLKPKGQYYAIGEKHVQQEEEPSSGAGEAATASVPAPTNADPPKPAK